MTNIQEKVMWKPIKNYETKYLISNLGQVKSMERKVRFGTGTRIIKEKILKPRLINKYYSVCLTKNNKIKYARIHRLVAKAFIPNIKNKEQVNHKDGNKLNNYSNNLEWVSCSENHKHAYRTGLRNSKGERHPQAKIKNKDVLFIRENKYNYTTKEFMNMFSVAASTINAIKNYRRRLED